MATLMVLNFFSYNDSIYMNTISNICTNLRPDNKESPQEPLNYVNVMRKLNVPLLKNPDFYFNWRGHHRSNLIYFSEILTDVGICLSFNHLSEADIFNVDALDPSFLDSLAVNGISNRSLSRYTIEKGYADYFDCKSYPLRISDSAADLGFKFNLSFPEKILNVTCSGIRGFKVALHFPGEWPRIKQQFLEVPLNTKATITVKPQVIYTSKSLMSYKPEARQCYYQNERHLKFFKIYTKDNCEFECLTNFTLSVCGCVPFFMPSKFKKKNYL